MKKLLLLAALLFLISCSEEENNNGQIIDYLPYDSQIILITPDLEALTESLSKNNFTGVSKFEFKNRIRKELGFIPHLNFQKETGIAFSHLKEQNLHYTIVTGKDSNLVNLDSIQNKSIETINEEDLEYQKVAIENWKFFKYESGSHTIITNSRENLFSLIKNGKRLLDPEFQKVFKTRDPNKTSILFNQKNVAELLDPIFKQFNLITKTSLTNWITIDLDISTTMIKVNGITTGGNDDLMDIFTPGSARTNEITAVCPTNFTSLFSFSFSEFKTLRNRWKRIQKDSLSSSYPDILDHTREIGSIEFSSEKILVLNIKEMEAAKETMAGQGQLFTTYRDIEIYKNEVPDLFKDQIPGISHPQTHNYYSILDHFILFSANQEILQEIISAYKNSTLLATNSNYTDFMTNLSSEASILFLTHLPNFIKNNQDSEHEYQFNKNSLAALQIIKDEGFAHIHGVLSNDEASELTSSGVKQTSSIKLPEPLTISPTFFRNHRTDQMDIVVQGESNVLYLISNKGNVFWKKELDSRINGEIHQIDLFRNGNKQLAFSTAYQFYVIDRDGNHVKGFPIKFSDALTQPVSVFDYDNNRNYRFVLTQNNRVYMLGPKGKAIKGFDFDKAASKIVLPPKHIRLGTKDYILIAEESGKLNILSRQGNIRVPVDKKMDFSENEWFGYKGNFISSSPTKNIISISQAGKVSTEDRRLAENNRIISRDDLLVVLNENTLSINTKTIDLDFGLYTDPQIFKIRNTYFISVTDTQAKKVYLFNADAEILEGFPVYGNSKIDISNADVDSKLELLVEGEENEILIYEF